VTDNILLSLQRPSSDNASIDFTDALGYIAGTVNIECEQCGIMPHHQSVTYEIPNANRYLVLSIDRNAGIDPITSLPKLAMNSIIGFNPNNVNIDDSRNQKFYLFLTIEYLDFRVIAAVLRFGQRHFVCAVLDGLQWRIIDDETAYITNEAFFATKAHFMVLEKILVRNPKIFIKFLTC
jgi:hypothetical protein